MQIPFFSLQRQHDLLKDDLANAYRRVAMSGTFILGGEVRKFEEAFAELTGSAHCITCGNGTDALELILEGLNIPAGAEVILPDNTWMSVAEAVIRAGGRPVYCDVSASTFNLEAGMLTGLITEKTFAVIAVHQYGRAADMENISRICRAQDVFLVEDCAHAAGATYQGKPCGSLTDAAAFSFYPTKNLGAMGDGGAVTTRHSDLAEKISLLRNHGQSERDRHQLAGRNSRLDELQAAFLNEKLPYLHSWNLRRREIAELYKEGLGDLTQLALPEAVAGHIYHQYVVKTEKREVLKDFLAQKGVGTSVHYPTTVSSMGLGGNKKNAGTPVAADLCRTILSLPVFPELTDEEVGYVVKCVKEFF